MLWAGGGDSKDGPQTHEGTASEATETRRLVEVAFRFRGLAGGDVFAWHPDASG